MSAPQRTLFETYSSGIKDHDSPSAVHTNQRPTDDDSIGRDSSTTETSKPLPLEAVYPTRRGLVASAATPSTIDSGFVSPSTLSRSAYGDRHKFHDYGPLQPALWRTEQLHDLLAAQELSYSPAAHDSPTPSNFDAASDCGMSDFDDDLPVDCRMSDTVDRRALIDCGDSYCLHGSIYADRHPTPSSRIATPRRCQSADPWLQTPRLQRPAPDATTDHEDVADQLLQQLDDLQAFLQQQTVDTIGALLVEQDALYGVLKHAEALDTLADEYIAATRPMTDAEDNATASQEDEQVDCVAIDEASQYDWEVLDTSLPSMENGRTWGQWLRGR
ncbi:hypothetical protein LTR86_003275 [Recurvomyces mirabilis]|nr:hypothetical protein LTR86_003275 [Recurvomyces mirabilis]